VQSAHRTGARHQNSEFCYFVIHAVALVQWLSEVRPELATEIFIDIGAETGLRPGQQWQDALLQHS
jgi:hypothetical protein